MQERGGGSQQESGAVLGWERDRAKIAARTGGGWEGETISDGWVCVGIWVVILGGGGVGGGQTGGGTPDPFWYI